jgi:hypothetical protein
MGQLVCHHNHGGQLEGPSMIQTRLASEGKGVVQGRYTVVGVSAGVD